VEKRGRLCGLGRKRKVQDYGSNRYREKREESSSDSPHAERLQERGVKRRKEKGRIGARH